MLPVLGLLLQPYLLVQLVTPAGQADVAAAGLMTLLLVDTALFAAAVSLTYDWRLSKRQATGWLTLGIAFVAAQDVPFILLALVSGSSSDYGPFVGPVELAATFAAFLVLVAAVRGHLRPSSNPLAIGIAVGGVTAAVRWGLVRWSDPAPEPDSIAGALTLLSLALVLFGLLWLLVQHSALPRWAVARLAFALIAFHLSRAAYLVDEPHTPSVFATVAVTLAAVAACGAVAGLLGGTLAKHADWLIELAHRAAVAELSVRHDRERLHEANATIAGIASASQLLAGGEVPAGLQRSRLEGLLQSEMARLHRMLSDREAQEVEVHMLDDIVEPLIDSQIVLGNDVQWQSCEQEVIGRRDDIAEVVHILLANAARHAPGTPTRVEVTREHDTVTIRVIDRGPGVSSAVRSSLFQWGGRSPDSPGQGIGLQLAHRLMHSQGGTLVLEEGPDAPGAVFAITLPAPNRGPSRGRTI